MATPPKLTASQRQRLGRLEPQLQNAILGKNLEAAKKIVADIQDVLRPTGHISRLIRSKNNLFELALDLAHYDYAEQGFTSNRKVVERNTRLYLEATALLAICLLRKNRYQEAKPLIREVLQNEKVIRSLHTRRDFHKEIIQRFDEEAALFSLQIEQNEQMSLKEVQEEAVSMMASNTEDDIYLRLGKSLPKFTKDVLFEIDDFAKNQLPSAERKLLPSPKDAVKDEAAGKTVFGSLRRVIYSSLCDPESEVYKAWIGNGLGAVLDKRFITSAVVLSLTGLGIGFKALAVTAIALVIRLGLGVYCDMAKPKRIMDVRNR